ncbi:MAG: nicotinate-nicotinamide nucleotide adenylyltransferase [Gammaproteobacteria bacterium]
MPGLFGVGIVSPAPIVIIMAMRTTATAATAVLGGTFDPIHEGHLHLARRALRDFPAARVCLIPNGAPPHRAKPSASWHARMTMCQMATADDKRIVIGDDEPPGNQRRTIRTVRKLRRKSRVILIIGGDAFLHFRRWKEWRNILALASVAVARRRGSPSPKRAVPPQWAAKTAKPKRLWRGVYFWHTLAPRMSSTALRAKQR